MSFGKTLKAAQEKKGVNDSYVCRQSGVNRGTLRRWKQLDKTAYTEILNKICKELDITPNELLSYGQYDWDGKKTAKEQAKANQSEWVDGLLHA